MRWGLGNGSMHLPALQHRRRPVYPHRPQAVVQIEEPVQMRGSACVLQNCPRIGCSGLRIAIRTDCDYRLLSWPFPPASASAVP